MNRNQKLYRMVMSALLCAVGIIIPVIAPVKIPLGPMGSVTLGSHVAIFLAAFISPLTAGVVAVGTTIGFQLGGFPFVVVLRAATHIIWGLVAALWVKRFPDLLNHTGACILFNVVIAFVHAAGEVLICLPLFLSGNMTNSGGIFLTVFVLVGVVTLIHSTVDFIVSVLVWKPLRHVNSVAAISSAR